MAVSQLWVMSGGAESQERILCIVEGDVLIERKMTLHVWCWRERGSADSYLNSFPCRSTAQNRSTGSKSTGMRVTPLLRGPPEKCMSKKNSVSSWNVWLLQEVKCSWHHWKHLPDLRWFQYQTAAATGEKHHVAEYTLDWPFICVSSSRWCEM